MRRYHIRPTNEMRPIGIVFSIVFIIVACSFVFLGVTVVIPGSGAFGLLWTGLAVCFAVFGVFNLIQTIRGRNGVEIVDETEGGTGCTGCAGGSAEQRLQELRNLYDRSLITEEEYEEKRKEILREL